VLDAFGYSTPILNTLAQAVAVGLGFGIAAAIGIGVGLGSQDYVAAHIEEWLDDESAE
jgi:ABC-type nitrate/sulfonate/bicarbonate transport system permease component